MENIEQKKIIWIDEDINSEEKQYTYYELVLSLQDYQIIRVESVKEAFDIISDKNNYDQYKFKLFYVIVSGKLSEKYMNEYIKRTRDLHILAANIIYCSEQEHKLNEYKPYFLDTFLNPGKVKSSSIFIIDYIKSVECPYYLEEPKIIKDEIIENKKDPSFAAEFTYVNTLEEMAFPILISKHINCTLIEKEEFEKMQKEFMNLYPKLKHLFKPSQEKNIFIPYHILAKYYLHIYTLESNFFCDMNKELKKGNFDKYRIYIYLMYNALNKGIFKSFSKSNLYRGGTLTIEEFNSLMEKYNNKKNSESNKKIFFFSRKFLSFSKNEEVANSFLDIAIACEYKGVYVRFIVEGIDEEGQNFFVSNIDINEMKLSKFDKEEEVLFLPLSCFEVIDINSEIFDEKEIKVIRLRYLNKYKKEIDKRCEELSQNPKEKEITEFITNVINSKYAEELCRYLDNKNKFFYKILNELSQKTNIDIKFEAGSRFLYKNTDPLGKKYNAQKIFNGGLNNILSKEIEKHINWLETKISSFQFGTVNGKPCLGGFDNDGNLILCDDYNCYNILSRNDRLGLPQCQVKQNEFIPNSDKIDANNLNVGNFRKAVFDTKKRTRQLNEEGINQNEFIKNIKFKENKIAYKNNGGIEASMFGNAIGHFLANYEDFKKADFNNKIKIIGYSSIPIGFLVGKKIIKLIPILKKSSKNALFKKGFFVISLFDMCRTFYDIIFSESLHTGEKVVNVGKKLIGYGSDILFGFLGTEAGTLIVAAFSITSLPGSIIVGLLSGLVFGFLGGKISKEINKEKELIFYTDSLYYQYVPKKYREYAIPTLKWDNVPYNAKSYAIELIVNEDGQNPNLLVINIPPKSREYNELSKDGEIIISYKGIPENVFNGCFIFYVFDLKKIDIKEFSAMKNGLKEGDKLRKHLITFKILVVS